MKKSIFFILLLLPILVVKGQSNTSQQLQILLNNLDSLLNIDTTYQTPLQGNLTISRFHCTTTYDKLPFCYDNLLKSNLLSMGNSTRPDTIFTYGFVGIKKTLSYELHYAHFNRFRRLRLVNQEVDDEAVVDTYHCPRICFDNGIYTKYEVGFDEKFKSFIEIIGNLNKFNRYNINKKYSKCITISRYLIYNTTLLHDTTNWAVQINNYLVLRGLPFDMLDIFITALFSIEDPNILHNLDLKLEAETKLIPRCILQTELLESLFKKIVTILEDKDLDTLNKLYVLENIYNGLRQNSHKEILWSKLNMYLNASLTLDKTVKKVYSYFFAYSSNTK